MQQMAGSCLASRNLPAERTCLNRCAAGNRKFAVGGRLSGRRARGGVRAQCQSAPAFGPCSSGAFVRRFDAVFAQQGAPAVHLLAQLGAPVRRA